MKFTPILALAVSLCALAQTVAPDTVVATIDGKKVTAAEMRAFLTAIPPQAQQNFVRDPKAFVQQVALMMRIAEMAAKAKLDLRSPYKEQIEFNRMYVLFNAQTTEAFNNVLVTADDQRKFYEASKDRYKQVKVKVIYLSFSSNPSPPADDRGKKPLTELQAQAKAERLLAELRAGADFVKLAKQHSEDAASVAKEAEFGTIRKSDKIPESISAAVFALKTGELSPAVRAPNGYYIFRAEEVGVQPYDQVKDEIFQELKQAGFREWMEAMQKRLEVKIENDAFFASAAANVPAAPKPK